MTPSCWCRRQSSSFWLWGVLALGMTSAVVLGWYHLTHAQSVERPELSSTSTLEDVRGVVNRNTELIRVLRDKLTEVADQHKWLLGLLVATLVGVVAELVTHYTPRRRHRETIE